MKKINKIIFNFLKISISVLIISLLIYKIGFNTIVNTFKSYNLLYLIPIFLIHSMVIVVESINIYLLLRSQKNYVGYFKLLKFHFLSWSLGFFLLGKIGQFSIVPLLEKENVVIGKSSAIILVDKVSTLFVYSVFGYFGLLIIFPELFIQLTAMSIAILFAFLVFVFLHKKISYMIRSYILKKYHQIFKGFIATIKNIITKAQLTLLFNIFLTVVNLMILSSVFYLIFISLGYNINPLYVFLITPIGPIISYLPISFGGIGVREISVILLYSQLGVPASIVFTTYLISTIMVYVIASLGIFLFFDEFKDMKKIICR